jgi:hypothetical protein
MKEKDLVENYINIQIQNNYSANIVKEFGYRQKKIDVIEVDLDSNTPVHGIEFKIKDWKLGFKQCLGNRILVPYNSLALYHKYIKNVNIESLKQKGIGLISLHKNESKQLIKPKKSSIINLKKHSYLLRNLSSISGLNLIQ